MVEPDRFQKTPLVRRRILPIRSSGSITVANSDGRGSVTMLAMSAVWSAIPRWKAGMKCSGLMDAKGAIPKGVVQVSSRGLSGADKMASQV